MEKEKFSQIISVGLRTGLSGIPGCSWIAQAWSEYDSFKQSKRINAFFESFQRLYVKSRNKQPLSSANTPHGIRSAEQQDLCMQLRS